MNEPEPGFYYHYKHDQKGSMENMAYEVIAVGNHSETMEPLVIYRSLYKKAYWLRPQEMFLENVTKEGRTFLRFQRITDSDVVERLRKIKDGLYRK